MANTLEVTDATFQQEVLDSATPVLVDFWAEWCGPCRMVAPVVEQIAAEQGAKLKVAKLNVDDNNETTLQYGVRGIPTLILFKGGKAVERIVGALPKPMLMQRIQAHLS
jgi:thioredoxin 1